LEYSAFTILGSYNLAGSSATLQKANKYRFEFTPSSGPAQIVDVMANGNLAPPVTPSFVLDPMEAYTARVRVSYNNGATYCNAGPACTINATLFNPNDRVMTDEPLALDLYPNPVTAGESLNIKIAGLTAQAPIVMEVLDMMGRQVFTEEFSVEEGSEYITSTQPQDIVPGVYTMFLVQGDQIYSAAYVVE